MSTRRSAHHRRASWRVNTHLAMLLRMPRSLRSLAWIGWAAGAALALLLALGLSFTGQSGNQQVAAAAPAQRAWEGRASAPELPPVVHFFDSNRNTSYTVWLRDTADNKAGAFVFTLRDYTQIKGNVPITQIQDNTFIQSSSSFSNNAVVTCTARVATASSEDPANVFLQARIDKSGLVAYAQIGYSGCRTKLGGEGVMESGCTPTSCNDLLAQVGPAVQQYDSSMVAATADRSQDSWNKVYGQICQTVRAQYSPEQFAAELNKQIDSLGRITAISPITSAPIVQYDTGGHAFYAVKQRITYSLNGATTTRDSTTYYLAEGGQWVFWFSA